MSSLAIADVEAALMALVASDSVVQGWTPGGPLIQDASSGSYTDESGQLLKYPALLFLLESFAMRPGDRLTFRTYEDRITFRILCWQKVPAAPGEEKTGGLVDVGVYEMLHELKRILGGARLLVGSLQTDPIILRGGRLDYLGEQGSIASLVVEVAFGFQATGVTP